MQNENPSLGSTIIDSRKKLGLSQEALAEKANVSLSTIQRIEKGTVKPRSFTLKTLATALEIDFSELITESTIAKDEISQHKETEFVVLKRMAIYGLFGTLIPLFNIIIPYVFWRKKKENFTLKNAAGKLLSFQILWLLTVIICAFLSSFIVYLITGLEGYRPFPIEFYLYLFFIIIHLVFTLKVIIKLNVKESNIFPFIPNLF
ncbi:MAG: helix-turn-helix domain-containing protein [Flavobacteriaceae bacterium]|nr:helix-turn-helix domain-containing protein [Flavobacteriaceae bacterium]